MPTVADVSAFLEEFAPRSLAESWDNVGLLVGRGDSEVRRIMTCLTLTPDVCAEAIAGGVQLIVTHHPVLFRGAKTVTDATAEGKTLLELIENRIAVFSPHTAFDSAEGGINQYLSERLGLIEIRPLKPINSEQGAGLSGSGRFGRLAEPMELTEFLKRISEVSGASRLEYCGDLRRLVCSVGLGCGAGESFLGDARRLNCDTFLTGEARFHTVLDARTSGINLVLLGHYWSERPAVEMLAKRIASQFSGIDVWASGSESDPLRMWKNET
ncbi:MAG: Nif3-like dinuclear metal center hexameric protein [Planctomyces sp.]|nr:Nif3-like dinuclear metal center hexameric protein [Planctomyces sp.]